VKSGAVKEVMIEGNNLRGRTREGDVISSYMPDGADVVSSLSQYDVRIDARPDESNMPGFFSVLVSWFPMLLFIGVWIFFMRQMQGGGKGGAMGFGKSRAKLLTEHSGRITFEDVAGIDEAKTELEEVVEFLKDPGKFQRLGGKIPKGVLLVGPPGTGKTLLARAIAGEANVPFFTISGSDFVEMFVGVGASRVRDMFEQGKKNAPCIIFIDEIDAVGRHRGAGVGGGNDEREQTLNQMLVEMDGFEANEGVILIAATNRPDVLDPALLRPGRFDRQVVVPNPDVMGRERILKVHMRKTPLAGDVEPRIIARGTPGFSGADLANLVNEAALLAARKGKRTVSMAEFEEAKDKVMMGSERRSMVMTDDEKKLTAYHEAGHAVVALHSPASDPIHKATIIPRGRALGMVMRLPEGDRISMAVDKLLADLRVACGGRIAEEQIFGAEKVTTGASSDIRMATDVARRMVTEWGMSDKLGFLAYGGDEQEVFLGRSMTQSKNMSEATADVIDSEIRRIVDLAYKDAAAILKKNAKQLELLAQGLLEYETLNGDEIKIIVEGGTLSRAEVDDDDSPATPRAKRPRAGLPTGGRSRTRPDTDTPGSEPV
jgi:cell division protease FtsH